MIASISVQQGSVPFSDKPKNEASYKNLKITAAACALIGAGIAAWKYGSAAAKTSPGDLKAWQVKEDVCYDPALYSPLEFSHLFKDKCVDPSKLKTLSVYSPSWFSWPRYQPTTKVEDLFWASKPTIQDLTKIGSNYLQEFKKRANPQAEQRTLNRALAFLTLSADRGDLQAQNILGDFYSSALTLDKKKMYYFDYPPSLNYLDKKFSDFKIYFQNPLMIFEPEFFTGDVCRVNREGLSNASQFYEKAVEQGDADAAIKAAHIFYTDSADISRSYQWIQRAADLGDRRAQLAYSAYLRGKNETEAARYFELYRNNKVVPLSKFDGPIIY